MQRWKERVWNREGLEESGGELKDRARWVEPSRAEQSRAERHMTGCQWRLMTSSCQSRSHRESRAPAICSKVNGKETRLGRWHGPERMDGGSGSGQRMEVWAWMTGRAGWRPRTMGITQWGGGTRTQHMMDWLKVEDWRAKWALGVKGIHHLNGFFGLLLVCELLSWILYCCYYPGSSYGLVLAGYCVLSSMWQVQTRC